MEKNGFICNSINEADPPKDCIPIRKLQSKKKKKRHYYFHLFSTYIQMFLQSDNDICLLSSLLYLEGKKSWKLYFSHYLSSIMILNKNLWQFEY